MRLFRILTARLSIANSMLSLDDTWDVDTYGHVEPMVISGHEELVRRISAQIVEKYGHELFSNQSHHTIRLKGEFDLTFDTSLVTNADEDSSSSSKITPISMSFQQTS